MTELFFRGGGMNLLGDTIIQMVVAFVAGEPARRLLPLARRFVPEPMQMSYIVTDFLVADFLFPTFRFGVAACLPHALADAIRQCADDMEWDVRIACDGVWDVILQYGRHDAEPRPACPDDHLCTICFYGVADIVPVRQVTLQTRRRLPAIPNSESFCVFISDRIDRADMRVCSL